MGEIWILWFTITISAGHIGHFPVDHQYPSSEACLKDGRVHWAPMLEQQFPNDPHLTVYCKPGQ